jgi:tetratricopeptide (TPR) repeat protein
LQETPCLLVLDNVEAASGIGENPPILNDGERDEMRRFLQGVCPRNGATRLLVTSRREEPWLGVNTEAVEVRGLGKDAWDELALAVLRASGLDPVLAGKAADPAWQQGFDALLQALGGHPLALQIILPHLKDRHPDGVLRGLSEGDRSLDGTLPEGASERERTLAGCVNYSFAALPEGVRALAPLLACFREWVDAEQLAALCNEEGVPAAARGTTAEAWAGVLREVAATGLVRQQAPNLYRLSPLLPWFLRSSLSEGESEGLERATIRYHQKLAYTLTDTLRKQEAENAVAIFAVSQASIYHALDLARRAPAYEEALTLFDCLGDFYSLSGQHARSAMLLEALRKEVPPPPPREAAPGHARLYLALTLRRGNKLLAAGDLAGAEKCYKEVLDAAPNVDEFTGAIYFNLGRVAEERHKLDEAEDWYRKSLDVRRRLGHWDLAQPYKALGDLARERHRLEDAAHWYGEALQSALDRGDPRGEADSHYHLGVVAQEQHKLDEAERRYGLALGVRLRLRDTEGTAHVYHQLGMLAQERHDLEQAEQWYRKSLELRLQSAGEQEAAKTYHQLGLVAKERSRLAEAEDWFRKSLEMELRLANEHGAAMTYVELGEVATAQRDWDRADECYNKALEVFRRLRSEKYVAETYSGLGRLWRARQNPVAAKEWVDKALEISLRIGDKHSTAHNYLSLSAITQEVGDVAAGEDAANKALEAFVSLGDDYGAALAHNNLGALAAARENNEQAVTHFLAALEVFKRVDDRPRMAPASFNLAAVMAALGDAECVKFFLFATSLFFNLEDSESAGRAIDGLVWAMSTLGIPYGDVEQAWQRLRRAPVPVELRELILSRLNGAEEGE